MEMNEFILRCFGIDAGVLEEFCKEFDLDWDEDEVFECFENVDFKHCNWEVAQRLLVKTFEKIRDLYEDETDEKDWDYDVSSPSYPCFYYNGHSFNTKEKLEQLIEDKETYDKIIELVHDNDDKVRVARFCLFLYDENTEERKGEHKHVLVVRYDEDKGLYCEMDDEDQRDVSDFTTYELNLLKKTIFLALHI